MVVTKVSICRQLQHLSLLSGNHPSDRRQWGWPIRGQDLITWHAVSQWEDSEIWVRGGKTRGNGDVERIKRIRGSLPIIVRLVMWKPMHWRTLSVFGYMSYLYLMDLAPASLFGESLQYWCGCPLLSWCWVLIVVQTLSCYCHSSLSSHTIPWISSCWKHCKVVILQLAMCHRMTMQKYPKRKIYLFTH